MIQCPICQVLNEDGSLFCAECGQRFSPASTAPQPPAQVSQNETLPPDQEPSRPKQVKLRSPMLGGGGGDDDDDGYEKPQMNKLRGTGGPRSESDSQHSTGKKHLRSPLLGGDDSDSYDDDYQASQPRGKSRGSAQNDPQENTIQRKKKLRSPLLGEDDDDDNEDFTPEPGQRGGGSKRPLRSPLLGDSDDDSAPRAHSSGKKGSLRSPLLGGSDDDYDDADDEPRPKKLRSPILGSEPHSGPRHRGLHSPLLGDADDYDDDDEPSPARKNQSQTGGKPKLRSALLGGGYDDDDLDDDWDEDDEDNPDVLRSPLLAAKRKRPKPAAPAASALETPPGVQVHEPPQQIQNVQAQHPQGQNVQLQPPQYAQPPQQYAGQPPAQPQPAQQYAGQPPAQQMQPHPGAPPFPGPSEPQPPWQGVGAPPLPGWPTESPPQPGQPWPPQGMPNQGGPVTGPPLPAGSSPGTPPWQTPVSEHPAVGVLRSAGAAHEVPPIVDDNEEFQLDISEPTSIPVPLPAQSESPRPVPPQVQAQPTALTTSDPEPVDLVEPKPERRNRIERRRGDRRFSSTLLDDKSGSKSYDDDDEDDFSVGRPSQPKANSGLATMMLGLGGLALAVKVFCFYYEAGVLRWDIASLPHFLADQVFSGIALLGLIVLALSSMKK